MLSRWAQYYKTIPCFLPALASDFFVSRLVFILVVTVPQVVRFHLSDSLCYTSHVRRVLSIVLQFVLFSLPHRCSFATYPWFLVCRPSLLPDATQA